VLQWWRSAAAATSINSSSDIGLLQNF